MDYQEIVRFAQQHFTDGLVIIVGSGLSAAEGMSGMSALADYLQAKAGNLTGQDAVVWGQISSELKAKVGLEAALVKHQPSTSLETWIAEKTCELLLPEERALMTKVIKGEVTLRLTKLLRKILKPSGGLPILTTNYDRLIELGCEMAGMHVDTTAVGLYAGAFDHQRSCMGSCRGITTQGKTVLLDHFPRAVVLKPHGSFDWYRYGDDARRCSVDLDIERLIITPGLNKYRAGYNTPFDKQRDLANDHIKQAARLLVIGYGFNDDHLQTHLLKRIRDGTPTLVLTRTASDMVRKLAQKSPNCVCVSVASASPGISVVGKNTTFEHPGDDLWDIGILAEKLL